MSYTIKILPEGGSYIGYALQNNEVVLATNPCKDAISASREITRLIGQGAKHPPIKRVNNTTPLPMNVVVTRGASTPAAPSTAPRRCCGRG